MTKPTEPVVQTEAAEQIETAKVVIKQQAVQKAKSSGESQEADDDEGLLFYDPVEAEKLAKAEA